MLFAMQNFRVSTTRVEEIRLAWLKKLMIFQQRFAPVMMDTMLLLETRLF